jgi:hypothetical protein
MEFVRTFLQTAFGADSSIIVPRVGRWFNPQDLAPNGSKPATWCAYRLGPAISLVNPFYQNDNEVMKSTAYMKQAIEIQLIGTGAEDAAQSIAHWTNRSDLKNLLDDNLCQLMVSGMGSYIPVHFDQDGENAVLAYNAKVMVQWASIVTPGAQSILTSATVGTGSVTNG